MSFYNELNAAVYSQLSGGTALVSALGGTAIYHGVAPEGRALPGLRPGDLRDMEMTRRRFVRVLAGSLSAVGAGLCWVGQRVSPRRIVRAVRLGRYPGQVVPMGDMRKQSRWSG